jgi:hypothetical protein
MALTRKLYRLSTPGLTRTIPILAVIMEVFWVYAWLVWFSMWPTWGWDGPPLTPLSCLVLVVYTQQVTRFSLDNHWSAKRTRLVVLPGSIILLAVFIRWNLGGGFGLDNTAWFSYITTRISALVTALVFGTYLIWRGIANGRQQLAFRDVYGKFVIGLAGIVFLLIFWGLVSKQNNIWSAGGIYIILFFGVGLLSMAMANLESLRSELTKYQEATAAFTRRWISMLVALVLGIIGLSLAVASIFSTNIAGAVFHGLSILGNWLMIALSYILLPLGYVLELIIYLGRLLIAWLTGSAKPVKLTIPDLSDLQKAAEGKPQVQIPSWILLTLKWGFLAIVIGLVIFFLAKALIRYWEGRPEKDVEEIHETLWSFGALKVDLRSILSWLFHWFHRKKSEDEYSSPPRAVLINDRDDNKKFNIREIYQALLWEGREAGAQRRQSETPSEYRKKLEEKLGKGKEEIEALTQAYVSDRYGEVAPEAEKLNFLNREWRNLKAKLSDSTK